MGTLKKPLAAKGLIQFLSMSKALLSQLISPCSSFFKDC